MCPKSIHDPFIPVSLIDQARLNTQTPWLDFLEISCKRFEWWRIREWIPTNNIKQLPGQFAKSG